VILTEDEIRELEDLSPIPGDRNAVPLPDEAQNANP
jgi:hypothetical protein